VQITRHQITVAIPGVLLITPARHGDERGWFSETFRQSALEEPGFTAAFVQDNHVRSTTRGIQRGLHYQKPPHAQDKLLRCVVGAIFDVAVDIRKGSPTYGQWVGAELSAENRQQLLVPKGFAHGYVTLTDACEVLYKVTGLLHPGRPRARCAGAIRRSASTGRSRFRRSPPTTAITPRHCWQDRPAVHRRGPTMSCSPTSSGPHTKACRCTGATMRPLARPRNCR
jgi:dTDP-4-dehydrorhamnose 3,5-epimerase